MKYFRKLITYRKLAVFLAIGMLLRSTIAVGYMLDTNPADGSFLSVMICEGPAGINAIAGLDDQSHHHENHHSSHDNTSDKHEHVSQDHPISSCSFWSASSLSLSADISSFDIPAVNLSDEIIDYQIFKSLRISNSTRFARAPPASL